MKLFLLLLLTTTCVKQDKSTAPAPNTEAEAVNKFMLESEVKVELDLEYFTNYTKYFEQYPRYSYITLENGIISSDSTEYAVNFNNSGKTIIYTNKAGGLIVNDEEVLLSSDEMEKIYDFTNPFFEHFDGDTIARQLSLYTGIDKHLTNKLTNLNQIAFYLKQTPFTLNTPVYLIRFYLATCGQDLINYSQMIYDNISNEKEKKLFYTYFLGAQNIDLQIKKSDKIFSKLLVFDTLEKTRIRMLNLMLLSIMISQGGRERYIFMSTMLYHYPYGLR